MKSQNNRKFHVNLCFQNLKEFYWCKLKYRLTSRRNLLLYFPVNDLKESVSTDQRLSCTDLKKILEKCTQNSPRFVRDSIFLNPLVGIKTWVKTMLVRLLPARKSRPNFWDLYWNLKNWVKSPKYLLNSFKLS